MTPDEADDELLIRLMADYDEVLAAETPADGFDDSIIAARTELTGEWAAAKLCLERLHRARDRRGEQVRYDPIPTPDPPQEVADNSVLKRVGRFVIERELGRGGLGVVFLAHDPQLGRKVAVKIPRFEALLNTDLRRRFLREAEAAARLNHPNLVTLHDVGEDGAICYLASEYCDGPNLAEWLRARTNPVSPRMAAALAVRLAEGVEHAHGRGVLHRDIKPGNVLLAAPQSFAVGTPAGELNLVPKLTDFGMAKILESAGDETRAGAIIGTPAYMAPEQAEGRVDDLDGRTDVYALGAILYELLTGAPPFRGKSDLDTLRQLVSNEPIPPRSLRANLPRDLEAIALKCLSKRPEGRYATAHELTADLRRFLAHEPTLARPLTSWQRVARWTRRRPALAGLSIITLLAATILAAGGLAYTVRLRHHAEELSLALASRDEARASAQARVHQTAQSYTIDIRLAQLAWKAGRVSEAKLLLAKHQPRAGETDNRSFPWHFLWGLCQTDEVALSGDGEVYVCRYSPDGRLLATGGEDGRLRLFNAASRSLERSWQVHTKEMDGIAFSPDGRWVATTAGRAGAALSDLATGEVVDRFSQIKGVVSSVAFAPDGQTLVVGTFDGSVSLVDMPGFSVRQQFPGLPVPVLLLAVSPDGAMLASTGEGTSIRLWKMADMQPIAALDGHSRDITALAFSHDGAKLASASEDGTVRIWDTSTRILSLTFELKTGYVKDVSFAPDDRNVIAAGHQGDTQLWSLATNKPERILQSSAAPVFSAAISPDGRQIAAGGADGLIHLWNGPVNPESMSLVPNAQGRAIALSPDARIVAIGDEFGNLRLYDSASGDLQHTVAVSGGAVEWLAFSGSGDLLAIASADQVVRLWRFPDVTLVHALTGHEGRVRTLKISPDGSLIATGSDDKTVRVWDATTGVPQDTYTLDDLVRDVSFSPDSQRLASAGRDGAVYLWRLSDGTRLAKLAANQVDVHSVAWSPDGKLLASAAMNDTFCLWDMTRLELLKRITPNQGRIHAVAFSPDGKTVATGSEPRTITFWDVASLEELLVLAGHGAGIWQLEFSPHGDFLLSLAPERHRELFRWPAR